MNEYLGNDVIKLQKEIMNITKKLNTVRYKTHKSMSSILKGLKSIPKDPCSKHKYNLSSNKNNKIHKNKLFEDENYYLINSEENSKSNMNSNNHSKKKKTKYFISMNNDLLLNDCKNHNSNDKEIYTNNYMLLYNVKNKKGKNQPIKCRINDYKNYNYFNNEKKYGEKKNYTIFNDDLSKNLMKKSNKKIPKTDSFKYLYNNHNNYNNHSKNYTYDGGHFIINESNYESNIISNENENSRKEVNHNYYVNKLLTNKLKYEPKSRNKNEIEDFKNEDFFNDNYQKTYFGGIMKKYDKNYNKININSFSKNRLKTNKYNHNLAHYKSNKNIFRKNTSTKENSKENNKNYFKYNIYSDISFDKNENINNIFELLNVKCYNDCIDKINKLLNYEHFIHKLKKLYYNYNGNNKDFELKDILFWISFNLNNENQYEEFCMEIMEKFNISDFEHFKKFFKTLINKDKNNKYFVNGMKQLFNNFNDYHLNKTIYKNRSKKSIQTSSNGNDDDINNK